MGTTPAGWYQDNQDVSLLRWWDGFRWTAHTHPRPVAAAFQPDFQAAATGAAAVGASMSQPGVGRHGSKLAGKRDLQAEVARLQQELASVGVAERAQLSAEVARLRDEVARLRHEEAEVSAVVLPLRVEVAALSDERTQAAAVQAEVQRLQEQRDGLSFQTANLQQLAAQGPELRAELAELNSQLVETRETMLLQEAGVYEYRHPLDDALAYKAKLTGIRARIKDSVKAGTAVKGSTNWTVNGSARDGAKMVKEFSKLMLRAYNNEADNAVHSMKPYTLDSSVERLQKARETITRLGGTMHITVTDAYHRLRVEELELTADYLAKVAEEKERTREERAKLREEEIARREYEREQDRLRKELAHYQAAIAALSAQGDHRGATQAEAKLTEINDALDGLSRRAANIRAGHVYVISNIGAFGADVVKVGMTRRLDPMDRVRELGDASVPFHYDVHALVFSEDAVGLETHLHHQLADRKLNLVNTRREFFRARPGEVRDILARLDASIITWIDEPEALEWRQSEQTRRQQSTASV